MPNKLPEKLLCAHCGDVIGVYEPMILVEEGKPRKTCVSAERDIQRQTDESYHAACYPP